MSEAKRNPLQELVRLEKYEGYYICPANGRITYRKSHNGVHHKIATGVVGKIDLKTGKVDGIAKAREIVEIELEKRRTGKTESAIKRERRGVTNPLLEDLYKELSELKTEGKEQATKDNYAKAWRNGMAFYWRGKTAADFKTENMPAYKKAYLEHKASRLFEKTFDFMKMFGRFLVERKHIAELPDFKELGDLDEIIRKNKRYVKAGRVYTSAEQRAMLGAWEHFLTTQVGGTTTRHKRLLAARARLGLRLGLLCGLRMNEFLMLEREKVDLDKAVMHVWSFKNHKWREVPLVSEVVEAFKYQFEANAHLKSKFIFPMPSDPSRYLSDQVFDKTWYKVRDIAGVIPRRKYDARFHDLRKTFATMTAEEGWPWKVACEILDMSLEEYEKTYANKVSLESKSAFMNRQFGGRK
jgi:integrase